ncbi:MAG: hypothetical protein A3A86_08475 [Elusimicrobia bacterium RIFCSPLOWO2_01_FULL_60_11]|nr:MAG: hypothetical protein A3A86_08475 [Elusimicrobia bacterium RIFCSPLOWO2_01_FULL_60_11]
MRQSMETVVSVSPKDPKNSARRKDVHPSCLGVSSLYRLEGSLSKSQIDKIARELLCDPVVESFRLNDIPTSPGQVFVDVWYKPGVMDPAGASVLKAVRDLGIPSLARASCGARYVFDREVPDSVSRELLNPLIQERKVRRA